MQSHLPAHTAGSSPTQKKSTLNNTSPPPRHDAVSTTITAAKQQLEVCRTLQQAVVCCQQQVAHLVPSQFNSTLLDALQQLIDAAQRQLQEEQLQHVRACLEAALQLLARVSSLGPVEAFFVADELQAHYQYRVDTTHALLCRLGGSKIGSNSTSAPGVQPQPDGSSKQLKLPEQQHQIVHSFRQQASTLCPMLAHSCPPAALQQLCDTVKQGLVLVNGHSFLIGQDWQAEVAAMLARAEQLKVLLAHRQAHHLTLLASILQHMQLEEVQQYELPRSRSCSPIRRPTTPAVLMLQQDEQQGGGGSQVPGGSLGGGGGPFVQQFQQQSQSQQGCEGCEALVEDAAGADDDDDFFLPVAPIAGASGSAASAAGILPLLPCHPGNSNEQQSDGGDSTGARTPSSGCSSLLEYVQHSRASGTEHASAAAAAAAAGSAGGSSVASQQQQQQQWLNNVEQQLMRIAGSAEVAAVLATALGFEQLPCSRSSSHCGEVCGSAGGSVSAAAAGGGGGASGAGALTGLTGRQSSVCSAGSSSSPTHSRPGSSLFLARLSSSASKALVEGFVHRERSSSGGPGLWQQLQQPKQQPVQQRRRWALRSHRPSKTLCLQDMQLPAGICKSLGAVLYLCPHLRYVVLTGVGLDDEAVGDLVDALKVNSSIQHVDLSCNEFQDIGARTLAHLLRPSAGCTSRLRTLCLQHNQIGDDGAAALASGLASSGSTLKRLWLQHNAVGEAGAQALCRAMQHNTTCADLKLQPGNEAIPAQLAQAAQQLARQNRGVRNFIKSLLRGDRGP